MKTVLNKIDPSINGLSSRWATFITYIMPIYWKRGQFLFRIVSFKTFVYLLICFSWNILINFIATPKVMNVSLDFLFAGTFIQNISTSILYVVHFTGIFMILLFCHGLSKITWIGAFNEISFLPPKLNTFAGKNEKQIILFCYVLSDSLNSD